MCQTCIITKKCQHCGTSMSVTTHRLTAVLVSALFKFRRARQYYERNDIHLVNDMRAEGCPFRLTDSEWTNFSALRYHGLVHYADADHPKTGRWLITSRGSDFLSGKIVVPKATITAGKPARVINHSRETVHILEYRKELPAFESLYAFTPAPSKPRQTAQLFG